MRTQKKEQKLRSDRGIALVTALIVTLIAFMLIMSTLYVITSSITISGAGKRYATASECADGAVEVMKNAINLMIYGKSTSDLPLVEATAGDLEHAIMNAGASNARTVTLTLPSTAFLQKFTATIIIENLFTKSLPGGRIEFGRSAGGGAGSTAVYYRISTVCQGPKNTRAETTALYRFTN